MVGSYALTHFQSILATIGLNWANVAQFWPSSCHKMTENGNQLWTLTQQMHIPNLKLTEWLLFHIIVGKPKRTGGRKHRRTLNIPMSPPDFVGGEKNISLWLEIGKCVAFMINGFDCTPVYNTKGNKWTPLGANFDTFWHAHAHVERSPSNRSTLHCLRG